MDNPSNQDNNGSKTPLNEKKDIVLTITLQDNGILGVVGPGNGVVYDEMMCFWMLEKAKDHIKMNNIRAMQNKIVKPNFMNRVKGAFGK